MVLPLEFMVLVAIYIIIPGYHSIHGNKCPFKLALFSSLLFKCVSFIHSTILDCLPAFKVIHEKETLIFNKLFCFKTNMS